MNPEIKQRWIAALKSGDYNQAFYKLRAGDNFCCLGVLCDLHSKETGNEWIQDSDSYYMGQRVSLPEKVMAWAGLDLYKSRKVLLPKTKIVLSAMNDSYGKTFDEIATLIEEEL